MKNKAPQFELNLPNEPFRLTSETGVDTEQEQAAAERRRRHKTSAERAQWWFEQMRHAADHSIVRADGK